MTAHLGFVVPGKPIAQGSMRAYTRPGGHVGMEATNIKELRPYRELVGSTAQALIDQLDPDGYPLAGPVDLSLAFTFERPRSHYYQRKAGDVLRDDAPYWKDTAPDLDKLVRAVMDGLTGTVFQDDRQVAQVWAIKRWGDVPGTEVTVTLL